MKFILDFFRTPTLAVRVARELEESRHQLLNWHASREQAEAAISALNQRVRRLEAEQGRLQQGA